ncbi:MAG: c-type cytochrome [Mucilaginibacter sp.]
MKKTISLAITFVAILSINYTFAQTQSKTVTTARKTVTKTTTVVKKASAADIAAGQALISKADCLACHKLDVKLVGPAYKDVAKKYPATEANYEMLAKKVISGGSGNWGAVAMSPHPAVQPADAKKMVEYVLSLK